LLALLAVVDFIFLLPVSGIRTWLNSHNYHDRRKFKSHFSWCDGSLNSRSSLALFKC
jgi:hypothetical protein